MVKTRILIVDDHPVVRRGLSQTLSGEPEFEVCGEVSDVGEALEQLQALRPQLALVDISLPSGSGLELARQMLALDSELRVLFVSMHDDAVFAERALRVGAHGYINKSKSGDELLAAVRKVMAGETVVCSSVAEQLVRRGASGSRKPRAGVASLSEREIEVFDLIGRGLSTRDIADRLCVSVKTIEAHREHIKSKLHLKSGADLNRHAILWHNKAT